MANLGVSSNDIDFVSGQSHDQLRIKMLGNFVELSFKPVGAVNKITKTAKEICDVILKHMGMESLETGSTAEKVNIMRKNKRDSSPTSRLFTKELDVMAVVDMKDLIGDSDYEVSAASSPGFITTEVRGRSPTVENLTYTICGNNHSKRFISPQKFIHHVRERFMNQYDCLESIVSETDFIRLKETISAIDDHGAAIMLKVVPNEYLKTHGGHINYNRQALLDSGEDIQSPVDNISINEALVDLVPAIRIPEWPSVAKEWLTRRRVWPPQSTVDQIVSQGVMMVCKAGKDGNTNTDWRLSFSKPEIVLISDRDRPARQQALRIHKYMIKYSISPPSALNSYHCKTIFLWACERIQPDIWTWDNLHICVLGLLDDLISAVAAKNLPHYFIQGVNLIENISDDLLHTVGDKLAKLRRDPVASTHAHNPERTKLTALEQYGFRQFRDGNRLAHKGDDIVAVEILPKDHLFEFYMEENGTDEGWDRFEIDMRLLELKYGYSKHKIDVIRSQRKRDIDAALQSLPLIYARPFKPKGFIGYL